MKLALVIVSYNSYLDIQDLIISFGLQETQPDFIIVVDNCSPNGDGVRLQLLADQLCFYCIIAPDNCGFAAGCNIGIKYAQSLGATHIGLINPDTLCTYPQFFSQVVTALNQAKYSIIGTYVVNTATKMIEFGGASILPGIFYPKVRKIGDPHIHQNLILQIEPTEYTTGSSLFFPITLLDKIGYMDESYFLYFEETDWCFRARARGYQIGIISSVALEHKTSQSVGFRSQVYTKYMIRNYARFALRYARWYELPLWFLLYIGFWIPGQLVSHLYRKIL